MTGAHLGVGLLQQRGPQLTECLGVAEGNAAPRPERVVDQRNLRRGTHANHANSNEESQSLPGRENSVREKLCLRALKMGGLEG
jgi:hypothetical protein